MAQMQWLLADSEIEREISDLLIFVIRPGNERVIFGGKISADKTKTLTCAKL